MATDFLDVLFSTLTKKENPKVCIDIGWVIFSYGFTQRLC